jgi:DNA-binding NarL/FixJ family response regulator
MKRFMKIFLVEDGELILGYLRRMLSEVPGAALLGEARGQDEAIAGIEATRPDIVILDLALAQGSGIEVLRRIKPARPELRVIVLTSHSEPQYRDRCRALGAEAFLNKALDFESLPQHLLAGGDRMAQAEAGTSM